MSNTAVKLGVIGLGPRAETLFATLRNFSLEEVQITAVCDINPERNKFTCELFKKHDLPVPKVYSDHKELLADKDVDAVLIPTISLIPKGTEKPGKP